MRKTHIAFVIGLLHFGLCIALLFVWGGSVMSRFEGSVRRPADYLLDAAVGVLYFPFVHLAMRFPRLMLEGSLGYVPFFLNSALWAVTLVFVLPGLYRRIRA
jgi:hypothetical protein